MLPPEKLGNASDLAKASVYAVAAERETVTMESNFISTLRIQFMGTREVYMLPGLPFMQHRAKMASDKRAPHITERCTHMRSNMSSEEVTTFLQADSAAHFLCRCTVGPQDSLLLPAGWIFGERVTAASDLYGFKIPVLSLGDLDLLDGFNKILISQSKPSAKLQSLVDALSLCEG